MFDLITSTERDAVTTERDAVTTERDAVTTERDAVTTERDATTTDRNAVTTECASAGEVKPCAHRLQCYVKVCNCFSSVKFNNNVIAQHPAMKLNLAVTVKFNNNVIAQHPAVKLNLSVTGYSVLSKFATVSIHAASGGEVKPCGHRLQCYVKVCICFSSMKFNNNVMAQRPSVKLNLAVTGYRQICPIRDDESIIVVNWLSFNLDAIPRSALIPLKPSLMYRPQTLLPISEGFGDIFRGSRDSIQIQAQITLEPLSLYKSMYLFFVRQLVMADEAIIHEAESSKFLGMYLDEGLTWSDHIDRVCSKYILGFRLWDNSSEYNFDRAFRAQKKACEITLGELVLLTLPSLYILDVTLDVHQYETRGTDNFRTEQHRTTMFEHLPSLCTYCSVWDLTLSQSLFLEFLESLSSEEIHTISTKKTRSGSTVAEQPSFLQFTLYNCFAVAYLDKVIDLLVSLFCVTVDWVSCMSQKSLYRSLYPFVVSHRHDRSDFFELRTQLDS
ncbi:hypothetical protein J6590_070573 [Homalodisca vitripennis]|nr:hypothetical protein J6590_070573 [Homalodisca vitripennis]